MTCQGRFVQPPTLSFGEGTVAFEGPTRLELLHVSSSDACCHERLEHETFSLGDEDAEVKQVPAGATLYYDVELVRIIRP